MDSGRRTYLRRGYRDSGYRNIFKHNRRLFSSSVANSVMFARNANGSWGPASVASFQGDERSMRSELPSIGSFAGANSISQMFENSSRSTRFLSQYNVGTSSMRPQLRVFSNTLGNVTIADEGPSPYNCSVCGKILTSKTALKTHVMQQHEGKVVIKCPHCEKAFTRQSQLGKHIDIRHDERTGEYYCDKCAFKNRDPEMYNQHVHAHNICKFCQNEFAQLTRHEPKCPYRQ